MWRDALLLTTLFLLTGACLLVAPCLAEEDDDPGFVEIRGRTSGHGPTLEVVLADGTTKRLPSRADAGVSARLPNMRPSDVVNHALDQHGWQRVLLSFDLGALARTKSAHLILSWRQGARPVEAPLEVGLYRLKTAFDERRATYDTLPDFDTPADVRFSLDPQQGKPLRVDVTALVRLEALTKGGFPGWLVMSTKRKPLPAALQPATGTALPVGPRPKEAPKPRPGPAPRPAPLPKRKEPGGVDEWFRVPSRSIADAPLLRLTRADGSTEDRAPAADTMVISYIPQGRYGRKDKLSLDRGGRVRMLLRFDLDGCKDVERAELRLTTTEGNIALTQPVRIGVYELSKAWEESAVDWNNQPGSAEAAVATFDVSPTLGKTAVDVTDAVRKAAARAADERHGWLLRAAAAKSPAASPSMPAPRARPSDRTLAALRGLVRWAPDAAAAVTQAKAEGKLACALVRASYKEDAPNENEEIFLAAALAHPATSALLGRHFVPTRVWYPGWNYAAEMIRTKDPLVPLGTSAAKVKPLALVVADGAGKLVGTLEGIGTFSVTQMHGFLDDCLLRAGVGRWADLPGAKDSTLFLEGVTAFESEGLDAARKVWATLPKETPWRFLVMAYETWPERMGMYAASAAFWMQDPARIGWEPKPGQPVLAELQIPADKRGVLVRHAIDYLLRKQRDDGSWPTALTYTAYDAGITALCARALQQWLPHCGSEREAKLRAAVTKAVGWLDAWMDATAPEAANSFGTAYMLDLLLDLMATDPAQRVRAQRAANFHARGQAPSGGWGYDRNFAVRWRGGFGGWPVTTKGRVHSMNTGPALLSLARAKALGLRVDVKVLAKGAECLQAMKDGPGVFTYTHPKPRNFNKLDQSIGRACGCEEALVALGAGKEADLEVAVGAFLEHRADLHRIAKVSKGWTPPRLVSSYFQFFAYQHAARAIRRLPAAQRKQRLTTLRDDLLGMVEPDGTWVDYIGVGKPYGTACALLVLRWAEDAAAD